MSRSFRDVSGSFLHHADLRKSCVDLIRNTSELNSRFYDQTDFQNYINEMYKDGIFADELCIKSLSLFLQRTIEVYTPNHGIQKFVSPCSEGSLPVRLTHNGINHFDAVLYKKSPIESNQNFFSIQSYGKDGLRAIQEPRASF